MKTMKTMKIKCIKKLDEDVDWFTVGKIYEVKNSELKDDGGYIWGALTSMERVNKRFNNSFKFELLSDTPNTPNTPITLEQLKNLKVGDKVRLGDGKYSHWVSAMEKYRNQVVTIRKILGSYFEIVGEDWAFLHQREKDGKLESDIVEIISDEKPTPNETIHEKKEEPTVEQFTPESFKESVINFISKLPYKGGTVSFAICEAERARIIEGIRELDI